MIQLLSPSKTLQVLKQSVRTFPDSLPCKDWSLVRIRGTTGRGPASENPVLNSEAHWLLPWFPHASPPSFWYLLCY